MSYRDVRLWLAKISDAIAVLGIKRSELQDVMVSGFACIVPVIGITPECFVRLSRVHKIVATINRKDDFLRGEFRFRGIKITTYVWIQSRTAAHDWELLNQLSQPMLEVKRPAIGVKRTAIADKRRLIGLPAPKVVDVH
jgi:hypothetical protein